MRKISVYFKFYFYTFDSLDLLGMRFLIGGKFKVGEIKQDWDGMYVLSVKCLGWVSDPLGCQLCFVNLVLRPRTISSQWMRK